jgi:crotonobetainyl-CoA:carnitine CoA-transferase CaiB-like acyl-CoA transferase
MIGMLDFQAARFTVAGEIPRQEGNHHPTMRPMGLYATRDGAINVAAPWGRLWAAFCKVLGREDLAREPRYATAGDRARNRDALDREIGERLRERDTRDWLESLHAAGIPSGPVYDVGEVFDDPQVRHLGMAVPVVHPARGEIRILRNATRIEGHDDAIRRPAPEAGEQTDEILRDFGFSDEAIDTLRREDVV